MDPMRSIRPRVVTAIRSRTRQLHRASLVRSLRLVGSEKPDEILEASPVGNALSTLGIGPKTVSALASEGFTHCGHFWDDRQGVPIVPDLPFIGAARRKQLESWIYREVEAAERAGRRNHDRRTEIESRIAAIDSESDDAVHR
jgi:hypothetical protein